MYIFYKALAVKPWTSFGIDEPLFGFHSVFTTPKFGFHEPVFGFCYPTSDSHRVVTYEISGNLHGSPVGAAGHREPVLVTHEN
jgi:hypothetical protein